MRPPEARLLSNSFHDVTTKLALHVICGAVYGHTFDWESSDIIPEGHKMSFVTSLHILVEKMITLFIFPRWMLKLPFKQLTDTRAVYREFGNYLRELINIAKAEEQTVPNNALSLLVQNSIHGTDGPLSSRGILSDDELTGNAFLLLLAGHETV